MSFDPNHPHLPQNQHIAHHPTQPATRTMTPNSFQTLHDGYDVPLFKVKKFLPDDFPREYEDGRIPLRVQVVQDRAVLHTVLTKPKKGIYMCSHCNVRFQSFGPLLDHIDANNIKRPHRCTYEDCPWKVVGFTRLRQLNRHLKSVHLERKEYECTVPGCGKFFGRIDLLNRHVRSIHENKNSRFNIRLEAQRRSSTTSTGSTGTATTTGDSVASLPESHMSSPEITQGTIVNSFPHLPPPELASQSPPGSRPSFPHQVLTETEPTNVVPSNKYKHTIKFLTNSDE